MRFSVIREISSLRRFFWGTPNSEKQIVLYVEGYGYRAYLDGIIKQLTGVHGQTICYVTSDPNDPTLHAAEKGVRVFYLKTLLPAFMAMVKCRVFIMTLTDLGQFHLKRSAHPVHYVYAFHALTSTYMVYRRGAFDHYDSILCTGPHHVREIRAYEKLHKLPPKHLVEAGYYRLERIYTAYQRFLEIAQHVKKPTVLIAPSWGTHNIIESCGEKLVDLLLNEGYEVIVRPHPETVKRSPEVLHALEEKFESDVHFTLERSVATDESFLKAIVLITDHSGVSLEYALGTERPVLFLDVPLKIRNPDYAEIGTTPLELELRTRMGVVVSPNALETIPQHLTQLIASRDTYKRSLAELREECVYTFGHSAEVSTRHIMGLLNNSR